MLWSEDKETHSLDIHIDLKHAETFNRFACPLLKQLKTASVALLCDHSSKVSVSINCLQCKVEVVNLIHF